MKKLLASDFKRNIKNIIAEKQFTADVIEKIIIEKNSDEISEESKEVGSAYWKKILKPRIK